MSVDSVFSKQVTFRSFTKHINNITGEFTKDTFNDYSIFAEIQIQNTQDELVKEGLLKTGDAEGFFRGFYNIDAYGTAISPVLVPKIHDEILFNNIWYRIVSLIPEYWVESTVVFWDARLIKVQDEQYDYSDL